jgi:hypothetical protein
MTERSARKLRAGSGIGLEFVVAGAGAAALCIMRAGREKNERSETLKTRSSAHPAVWRAFIMKAKQLLLAAIHPRFPDSEVEAFAFTFG